MLQVLLLVFTLCFPTKSYLNYTRVIPLNSYRNNYLEKLPIPPNRLDEINSGSPFRRQHVESWDNHPLNSNRNIHLYKHPDGTVPNLNLRINKNNANPLLFNGRFPPTPFYDPGHYYYACINCYHCCQLYPKVPHMLLHAPVPLIVQKPRSTSSNEKSTTLLSSSTATSIATAASKTTSLITTTQSTTTSPSITTTESTTSTISEIPESA